MKFSEEHNYSPVSPADPVELGVRRTSRFYIDSIDLRESPNSCDGRCLGARD